MSSVQAYLKLNAPAPKIVTLAEMESVFLLLGGEISERTESLIVATLLHPDGFQVRVRTHYEIEDEGGRIVMERLSGDAILFDCRLLHRGQERMFARHGYSTNSLERKPPNRIAVSAGDAAEAVGLLAAESLHLGETQSVL